MFRKWIPGTKDAHPWGTVTTGAGQKFARHAIQGLVETFTVRCGCNAKTGADIRSQFLRFSFLQSQWTVQCAKLVRSVKTHIDEAPDYTHILSHHLPMVIRLCLTIKVFLKVKITFIFGWISFNIKFVQICSFFYLSTLGLGHCIEFLLFVQSAW